VYCVLQLIDFYRFEETFRIDQHHRPKASETEDFVDGSGESPKSLRRTSRRYETVSLLENNRMRNVGPCLCLFSLTSDCASTWYGNSVDNTINANCSVFCLF